MERKKLEGIRKAVVGGLVGVVLGVGSLVGGGCASYGQTTGTQEQSNAEAYAVSGAIYGALAGQPGLAPGKAAAAGAASNLYNILSQQEAMKAAAREGKSQVTQTVNVGGGQIENTVQRQNEDNFYPCFYERYDLNEKLFLPQYTREIVTFEGKRGIMLQDGDKYSFCNLEGWGGDSVPITRGNVHQFIRKNGSPLLKKLPEIKSIAPKNTFKSGEDFGVYICVYGNAGDELKVVVEDPEKKILLEEIWGLIPSEDYQAIHNFSIQNTTGSRKEFYITFFLENNPIKTRKIFVEP